MTRILVTTAHPQAMTYRGSGFGRLITPRHWGRIGATARAGIPWAADNDCFQGLDADRWRTMLRRLRTLPGCLFVVVPDKVGSHDRTLVMWDRWSRTAAVTGQPLAFVLQDGCVSDEVPWSECAAVFVGGSTEFKMSAEAAELVREAKRRGKHAHMGRVNSRTRYDYARAIGCDSVDGTTFSRWRDTYLPDALRWHESPVQEMLL